MPKPPPPSDEFYVGYAAKAPPGLARRLRLQVGGLLALVVALALLLASAQGRFDPGTFEYPETWDASGYLEAKPYPTLVLPRPGQAGKEVSGSSRYLLVAAGKHAVDEETVREWAGSAVEIEATPIYRGAVTMLELVPGSVRQLPGSLPPVAGAAVALGQMTLQGEIVDSKCFLGVMKPGRTKPHRGCAVRCISGGIPPMLAVAAPDGDLVTLLLVTAAGEAIGSALLDRVGEPVEVTGEVERRGDLLVLRADPEAFRRHS